MSRTPTTTKPVACSERSIVARDGSRPPGKDVGLDPVGTAHLAPIAGVRDGDGLEAHPTSGLEGRAARAEECLEVLRADRLEHLDRHDRVVGAGDVAIVAQLNVDAVLEAGGADPLAGEVVLLARDRDGGHAAAELTRGIDSEAAPSRPDLEHVLSRADRGSLGDEAVLVALRIGQGLARRGEDGTRVGERLVQPEPEEVVAEVVVCADVPSRVAARVAPEPVADRAPQLVRSAHPAGRQRAAHRGSAPPPGSPRSRPAMTTAHRHRPRRRRSRRR